jgi:single-stranded DNA-binding protein
MNHVIFKGNLVDNVKTAQTAQGNLSAFGKIGVYNGKDKNGEQRQSMFFDIVAFGRNAEQLRDLTQKGTPIVVSGRLEEDTTVSQSNGQTYVNKRVVCDNVSACVRPQQNVQQAQYTAGYAAPQPAYQAPVQNAASPW